MRVFVSLSLVLVGSAAGGCVSVTPPAAPPGAPMVGLGPQPPPPPDSAKKPFAEKESGRPPTEDKRFDRNFEARQMYRLDFALSSNDPKATVPQGTFTMNLLEDETGVLSMGRSVVLAAATTSDKPGSLGGAPRADVGLMLRESFRMVGEDLLVTSNTELSGMEDGGAIRKLVANDQALVPSGKPTLVSSIDDSTSHKHYQVMVTATKLR